MGKTSRPVSSSIMLKISSPVLRVQWGSRQVLHQSAPTHPAPLSGSHPTFWLWVQIPSVKINRYRCSFIPTAVPLLSSGRDGWVVVLLLFYDADDVKNDAAVYDLPFFFFLLCCWHQLMIFIPCVNISSTDTHVK